MTILNVTCGPSRIVVAMDTLGIAPDGRRVEQSKFLIVPHSNVLVGGRGFLGPIYEVFMNALVLRWTFDECKANATALFETALDSLRANASAVGQPDALFAVKQTQTLVLAGWSDAAHSMQAIRIQQREDGFHRERLEGSSYAPAFTGSIAAPQHDGDMLAIVRAQLEGIGEQHPDLLTGGRLLIAELTREKASVRDVGLLS